MSRQKKRNAKEQQMSLYDLPELRDWQGVETPTASPPIMETRERFETGGLYEIACELITIARDYPRKHIDQEHLESLIHSIESRGLVAPITCTVNQHGELILASGLIRLKAAERTGLPKITVLIVNGDPLELNLIENLFRKDLTAVEEAEAVKELMLQKGYSQEALAATLGKAASTISEILSVADLPAEIRDECRADPRVSREKLLKIARIKGTPETKIKAFRAIKDGKTVRTSTNRRQRMKPTAKFFRSISESVAKMSADSLKESELQPVKDEIRKTMEKLAKLYDSINK
ncbi:ParB/RepB/Spo0J family partition protein [Geobacter hydrogenophilus]|uniref:HTH cro/C1-type domain-containing protein n=1 Tax=Geobacter hydrogenophilus TaxID=40983 RepID=A0A9W6FX83_9BACT|nr:ParB/RepB/Spo0J family partition protein [Geobacter hydrogenophilus]MBT0895398.1 ParB/RepB/Spo0J family partition protein [Geobacter hydrogenophilus]GLI36520.1 hypothetical protein GHYDROH2_00210 [Geobacter hydrogenophilus]